MYKITREENEKMISDIQTFFLHERDEELSRFVAENILDFFKETIAPHYYNAGIRDSQKLVEDRMVGIEEDLHSLKRPIR
ncbi:DUF2164 domain-containing protein [Peribacillus alkalitolerans]|uniref:DUF2164 domain-containing protein n=1 Tax=Peribacillus alkalitolerans TaxID=1550385 RepID=UPI0013D6C656|nr:DUF2164 domain-containing protein [Peribacillus alkalitolerans]